MPNFSHYEVKRSAEAAGSSGEGWERAEECLAWELKKGTNRLEVRAVSTFNRAGPPSAIVIIVEGGA
jgi:hypothetical protein